MDVKFGFNDVLDFLLSEVDVLTRHELNLPFGLRVTLSKHTDMILKFGSKEPLAVEGDPVTGTGLQK